MKFYVECCKAKDKDTLYQVLKCDLGYRTINVSMEKDICSELLNVPISKLYEMEVGEKIYIKIGD